MPPIQENVSLLPFNTFKLDVSARYFTLIKTIADLRELIESPVYQSHQTLILGGGSNMLFTGNFDGLVIKNEVKGIQTLEENDANITLRVGSGENWHQFVMYCVDKNYGGLENLSLIPGTVGAAPMQNIGAYGVEVKHVIDEVEGIDLSSGKSVTFNNEACQFGYRESIFKHEARNRYFISSVTLTLTKKSHPFNVSYGAIKDTLVQFGVEQINLRTISDAVIHIRKSKLPDPVHIGNAGSFFKNPSVDISVYEELKEKFPAIPGYKEQNNLVKVPAGWLIEQCGWKGKTIGQIGVHAQQALVLVHYGGSEGKKIWELALQIQASVKQKFGIILQPEVNVISA
ncbi:MAG TPA: UDP-N-acetylmuramate dehydrogenase [Ohtaekwangia sp.]|nr:UDP-N-acetylmuramate dehydrogenase [Ohtaekwangia sp.]